MASSLPIVKSLVAGLLLQLLLSPAQAQTRFIESISTPPETITVYTVGEKLPDLHFRNLINYHRPGIRLSDLKGKLVILDFWELGCTNCIKALGKLQQLQQQFGDKIQTITVTSIGTGEQIMKALTRLSFLRDFSLPTVTGDQVLRKHFPFEFISHVVWIDGNGVVSAITGTEYLTEENIVKALKGDKLPWPVKRDISDFDYDKPVLGFSNGNANAPALIYSSALTGHIEGIDGTDRVTIDSIKGTVTFNHFNHNLLSLLHGSLLGQGAGYIPPKLLVLEVANKNRFLRNEKTEYFEEWAKLNTYCYSVTLPLSLAEKERTEFIRQDLSRWLGLLGVGIKQEMRKVPCYSITVLPGYGQRFAAKGGASLLDPDPAEGNGRMNNLPLKEFIDYLNQQNESLPFLFHDATGMPADLRVDLNFPRGSFNNIPAFKAALEMSGLGLKQDSCNMEMFVITEKKLPGNTK